MNKIILIILSALTVLLLSGCASTGYRIGEGIDENLEYTAADYNLPENEISLHPDQKIVVTLNDGEIYSGRVLQVDDTDQKEYNFILELNSGLKTFKYDNIKTIQIVKKTPVGRVFMTSVGLFANLLIIEFGYLFLYIAVYGEW